MSAQTIHYRRRAIAAKQSVAEAINPSAKAASSINNPQHWRRRAKEARSLAEQIGDPEAKAAMQRIAEDYERLAMRAQARAMGHPPKSP
jgi:hypothetical protein